MRLKGRTFGADWDERCDELVFLSSITKRGSIVQDVDVVLVLLVMVRSEL